MMFKENLIIKTSDRRQTVIDYVGQHPRCNENQVIDFCTINGEGSRVTVLKTIKELMYEGIIDDGKERKNSFYSLTLKTENPLLVIPKDLDEIYEKFKVFVDKITKGQVDEASSFLPHTIIELINDVYMFKFVIILPHKKNYHDIFSKLYSIYFDRLEKMFEYIPPHKPERQNSVRLKDIKETNLCKGYLNSKKEGIFGKLCAVVKLSRKLSIEKDLYNLLDLLWTRNLESTIMLYSLEDVTELNLRLEEDIKRYNITKVLKKIKREIDVLLPKIAEIKM